MSLTLDVLRWLTVQAVTGRTWAGQRVYDSPAQPADMRAATEREPFIAVYVDDADFVMQGDGMGLGMTVPQDGGIRLVIEVGVVSPFKVDAAGTLVEDDDPDLAGIMTQLNASDEGLEAQIGFISRQVIQSLLSTMDTNPWAELWRLFVSGGIQKIEVRRGGPGDLDREPKVRYASRITTITVQTLSEPVRGVDLDEYPFWNSLIQAFKATEELAELGALIEAHIVRPSGPLPEWRIAQKLLAVSRQGIRGIGLATPDAFEEEPVAIEYPPVLTQIKNADEGPDATPYLPGPDGSLDIP